MPLARRRLAPVMAALAAACAGGPRASTTPIPVASAPAVPRASAGAAERPGSVGGPSAVTTTAAVPGPRADLVAEPPAPAPPPMPDVAAIARELQAVIAAARDSAADAEALDRLDRAAADVGEDDAAEVEWDLDVARWGEHRRVRFWLEYFQTTGRERMEVWLGRLPRYEAAIRDRLVQRGLPSDLVYLALIESGFSNQATSRARAVGMWQFMRPTGAMYGLRIDAWVDERRDWPRATDAATRFLSDLYVRFGSPYLAAAAYNAGGGRVSSSLRRANRLGAFNGLDDAAAAIGFSDDHFFALAGTRLLHQETRDYVPKLIAAAMIAKAPARYGFAGAAGVGPASSDSIVVEGHVTLDILARLADTTFAAMSELNPHLLRLATPPQGATVVRVPAGSADTVEGRLAELDSVARVSYVLHTVKAGETVPAIAGHYGVSPQEVQDANPAVARGQVLARGYRVVVPTGGAMSVLVARHFAAPAGPSTHRVRKGETLVRIARRYDLDVADLRAWNRIGRTVTAVPVGRVLRLGPPDASTAARPGGAGTAGARPKTATAPAAGKATGAAARTPPKPASRPS